VWSIEITPLPAVPGHSRRTLSKGDLLKIKALGFAVEYVNAYAAAEV
jgi:hypothetical protein